MGKQSGYLQRQQELIDKWCHVYRLTYIQFMTDIFAMSMNDKEALGNDALGKERINKVLRVAEKNFLELEGALRKGPEQDYLQAVMDRRLRRIFGENMQDFPERYEYVTLK